MKNTHTLYYNFNRNKKFYNIVKMIKLVFTAEKTIKKNFKSLKNSSLARRSRLVCVSAGKNDLDVSIQKNKSFNKANGKRTY